MPIYEYRCGGCGRKVSLFFTSFSVAESRAEAGENRCPRCGSPELTRVMSRARAVRAGSKGGAYDGEMGADLGENGMGALDDDLLSGINQDDPREVARWARQMKESLGEEVDLGPDFDQALTRIEAGEDPERVMEDYDPEAFAAGDGDDGLSDDE
jgi:putative FmdB family regulatory protein